MDDDDDDDDDRRMKKPRSKRKVNLRSISSKLEKEEAGNRNGLLLLWVLVDGTADLFHYSVV